MNSYEIIQETLIISSVCLSGIGSIAFVFWVLFKRGVPPYEQLRNNLHLNSDKDRKYQYRKVNPF